MADRRVAKLYGDYAKSGESQAARRSKTLGEYWLKEHSLRLDKLVEKWSSSGGIELTINVDGSNYGCAAALFLMANFGTQEDLLDYIQRLDFVGAQAMSVVRDPMFEAHNIPNPIEHFSTPGYLFVFNMCVHPTLQTVSRLLHPEQAGTRRGPLRQTSLAKVPFANGANTY